MLIVCLCGRWKTETDWKTGIAWASNSNAYSHIARGWMNEQRQWGSADHFKSVPVCLLNPLAMQVHQLDGLGSSSHWLSPQTEWSICPFSPKKKLRLWEFELKVTWTKLNLHPGLLTLIASSFFSPNCRIWGKWSSLGPSVTWRFEATSALYLMLSDLFFPFNFCWLQHILRHPSCVVLCKVTFQYPPVSTLIPSTFCVRCHLLDRCLCITSSLYSPRVGWKLIRFRTL